MTPDLTDAQTRCLLALIEIHRRDGRATMRDVAERLDRNLSTVYAHLLRLRRMGLVDWDPSKPRNLRPLVVTR